MTATIRYFSGTTDVRYNGIMDNAEFTARFPGIKGKRLDSFSKLIGIAADGATMPITRIIEYKSNPSRHKCGARCINATGRICECSCDGKNHGANS